MPQDFCGLVNNIGEKARNRCLHCKQGSGLVRCKGCSVAAHPLCAGLTSRQQQVRLCCMGYCMCSHTMSTLKFCKFTVLTFPGQMAFTFVAMQTSLSAACSAHGACLLKLPTTLPPAFYNKQCFVPRALIMVWMLRNISEAPSMVLFCSLEH